MQLIAINKNKINNQEIQTVSARELHEFLGSGRDFSNWIQERVETYGFIDGMDFTTNLLKTPSGGRPRTEYHLSIDMAKELSMVERNEKGKQARQYFIECEKIAKNKPSFQLPDFNNPVEAARAWADQFEEKQIAYQKLEEQNQKIDSLENLFTEGMTIVAFCKQLNGVNTQAVSRFLVTKNWLYSDKKGWRAGHYARDKYLTEKAAHKYLNSKDEEVVTYKQELLKRGASRLHDMYMKGELPMKKDWDGSYDHSKFLFSREVA